MNCYGIALTGSTIKVYRDAWDSLGSFWTLVGLDRWKLGIGAVCLSVKTKKEEKQPIKGR